MMYYTFTLFLALLGSGASISQPINYSTANAHSHNDYEQAKPFWAAYNNQFGSIEADIFLSADGSQLWVAHSENELANKKRTLDSLYLLPLVQCIKKNNGYVYDDHSRKLQLLVDIKTEAVSTLNRLIEIIKKYPELVDNPSLKFVISGNRPDPATFISFPSFIWFDGNTDTKYTNESLTKIEMLSAPLTQYTKWNGKGSLPEDEVKKIEAVISACHDLKKPVRFWSAPDATISWLVLSKFNVDYINTDHINELSEFLKTSPASTSTPTLTHKAYQPTYKTDGASKPAKNIILLIGDGTGLPQLYAGYTANNAALSIFSIKNIGLSKTSSYDNYITDSAPGSTAISSGVKTNNHFVGVDHTGARVKLIPEIIIQKGIITGIVTCGDIADATPADFYAHRAARDSFPAIFHDLSLSPVSLIMGGGNKLYNDEIEKELISHKYSIGHSITETPPANNKWVVIDPTASLSILKGRGNWLPDAFTKAVNILSKNSAGFFLMTEAAQVDIGGHVNQLPYVFSEVIDFDEVVGRALKFADQNGETLVIVTADHETGGLTLLAGNYEKGYVNGKFSTGGHTALPVPVFAYGPQSQLFRGVYENTELFHKILAAIGMK